MSAPRSLLVAFIGLLVVGVLVVGTTPPAGRTVTGTNPELIARPATAAATPALELEVKP